MNLRRGRGRLETYRRGLADSVAFSAGRMPAARSGSWSAPTTLMPRIGTMNPRQVGQCRQQGAADVSSAELLSDSSAGKMPAAPWCLWKALTPFLALVGTTERYVIRANWNA